MNISVSTTYAVKWQICTAPEYKFTEDGKCVNSKTGNVIRMILRNRNKGFCIKGKFISLNQIRPLLERIPKINCPF